MLFDVLVPGETTAHAFGGTLIAIVLCTWVAVMHQDPVLTQVSNAMSNIEIPLNIALIVAFLAIGIGLAVVKDEQVRPFQIASIIIFPLESHQTLDNE